MAWFDDLNLPGATISGFFGYVTEDGPDDDDRPDVRLASGTVTFTATTPAARVDGAWLGIRPVTATIFDGEIVVAEEDLRPVRLLATDANIGVADWAWKASFDIKGFRLSELTFKAPRGTTVNLTADLIPIKTMPYQIIEGASIVDTEVDTVGERMRFKMSDGTFTSWVNVPNGEPGAKGDPGGKGDPGNDGQSPTISMGAVSAGANADAWLTGTPLARELNLTLPRGPKGDAGASTIAQVAGLQAVLDSLGYDSGWRNVSADLRLGWTGELHIRRVGNVVYWRCRDLLAGTGHAFYAPPAGMTSAQPGIVNMVQSLNIAPLFQLDGTGRLTRTYTAAALPATSWWVGEYVLAAGTPPPTSPPGIAVT